MILANVQELQKEMHFICPIGHKKEADLKSSPVW